MGSNLEPAEEGQNRKPLGIQFLEYIKRSSLSFKTHQAIVLIVTFLAYASYHATRKTTSIVKSALDPQSSDLGLKSFPFQRAYFHKREGNSWVLGSGWAPFDSSDGTALLGDLDVAFLSVYALGMYFSGHLGDRIDLRIFLTVGMLGTGLFTSLFGVGYWGNIHVFYYYLIVQMLAGLFQSTGWPSVVAVVGNWFGKKKRGLIMGIWNAHTSVGNITGSLVASALLKYGWGWSMVVPGLMIAFIGLLVFMILPVNPESVGADVDEDDKLPTDKKEGEEGPTEPLLRSETDNENEKAVGFIQAWKIPGVAPFALCLFFAKLVAYTFLYWLPFYISHTAIDGKYLSNEAAGNLSTLFDVGGVIGGILAGHISDRLDARAITAASFMYCTIPALFLYRCYGHVSLTVNIGLLLIAGLFVNGPYALITTAVSADLGTHSSLNGNSRALATVTAIIDGTGSIGAAIGPLLTGYISEKSWSAVFTMLMAAALVAGLLLTRLVVAEVAAKIDQSRSQGAASRPPTPAHEV
ncbi:putative glycerol-3-phosphate transporter 1 [Diospyros lotus]|uniref:putative glycerol-3-phosphate transporter 1 n=1 Tax=Diospyros lotus TaxID=55363 RepID=UPI0022547F6C|nr:putative glycerol-3-phosphate transporter 1 [Diospyros lotus]